MNNTDVAIIDYGVGNLFNIERAFQSLGADTKITRDPNEIRNAKRVVLPGVGAFHEGMKTLRELDLVDLMLEVVASGRPVLGICLGMQLLLTSSEEFGDHEGLNIIPGKVVRFQDPKPDEERYKIPQIGWNVLQANNESNIENNYREKWDQTLLAELDEDPYMYFVHSYCVRPDHSENWLATTEYGHERFCSVVVKDNVTGCQFHPERSGTAGLIILKNFLSQG